MAIQEIDRRYLKIIGISTVGFIVFLIAYSFFMPIWLVATPRGNYIGEFGYWIHASDNDLDRFPALKEVVMKTPYPTEAESRPTTVTLVSQQEWDRIVNQWNMNTGYEGQRFVIQYGDEKYNVSWVESFLPPWVESGRH